MARSKSKSQVAAELRAAAGREKKPAEAAKGRVPADVPVLPGRTFGMVPIDRITDAVDNIRSYRGVAITPDIDPSLPELAESIRQQGVIEPIVVHFIHNGNYCLIAGFRRFAAAKMAGLTVIPACIYEDGLSEQQIVEIQITENIHRSDLQPTEEASIYKRMAEGMGCTREEIAARVGKSVKHVSRYLKLLSLPDPIRAKIDTGEMSLAKANVMLSLTGINIERLIKRDEYLLNTNWTAKEFERRVKQKYMYELGDDIEFDVNKEYITEEWDDGERVEVARPPCTACPHRGQLELFEEYVTDKSCPNAECFEAKEKAVADEVERKRRAKRDRMAALKKMAAAGQKIEMTPEERKEVETEEAKREAYEKRMAKIEADAKEERRRSAEADLEEYEPLIAKKFEVGFTWPKDYFEMRDGKVLESWNDERDAVLDKLFKKYIGRGVAALKEDGSFEDIAMAEFIKMAYDDELYRGSKIALGLLSPDEDSDEASGADGEPDEDSGDYGVDNDGEALDSDEDGVSGYEEEPEDGDG